MAKNMWFSLKKMILWTSATFFYKFLAYSQNCEEHFNIFTVLLHLWPNLAKLSDRWWPFQLHHKTGKQNNERSQKVLLNATSCCHRIMLSFSIMYETRLVPLEQHWSDRHVYGSLYNMICFSKDVRIVELGRCLASLYSLDCGELKLFSKSGILETSLESLVTR